MFSIGKGGRVLVDEYLRAKGYENIFILGDSADTPYAGSAQTAIYDGSFVAKTISKMLNGVVLKKYKPKRPVYIVPIGKWWAVLAYKSFWFSGFIPFLIRGFADFKFFVSWLGFKNAISHFFARR